MCLWYNKKQFLFLYEGIFCTDATKNDKKGHLKITLTYV